MEKIALITGASRGLGAALAEALAPRFHIVAVARTVGALEELDDRIKARGGDATLVPLDINDDGAMQHMCRSVHDRWGHVNLWAHTAVHVPPLSPAAHVDARDLKKTVETNVTATSRLIGYMDPLLRAAPGSSAIFFDDPHRGEKFFGAYAATKAAQITLAESWQAETEKLEPKVHILRPAPMPTATRARFYPGEERGDLSAPSAEAERLIKEVLG